MLEIISAIFLLYTYSVFNNLVTVLGDLRSKRKHNVNPLIPKSDQHLISLYYYHPSGILVSSLWGGSRGGSGGLVELLKFSLRTLEIMFLKT